MVRTREIDFEGATVLTMFPENDNTVPLTFTAYSATVKSGFDDVAVDWGDGTVQVLVPDASTRAVTLSHTYGSRTPVTVRIQNKLDTLLFSHAEPTIANEYFMNIESHGGARALTGVSVLGSNVVKRILSPGLFANTSVSAYPTAYSAPQLSSAYATARCIPFGCFYNCPKLSDMTGFPSGLRAVDAYAFAHCTALTTTGLSGSTQLQHIGYMAYGRCTSLTSAGVSSSATFNPSSANLFGGNIGSGTVRAEMFPNPSYNTEKMRSFRMNMFLFPINTFSFYGCTSLTDISGFTIPSGQKIPPGAFQGCSSLSSVPTSMQEAYFADAETRDTYSAGNSHSAAYRLMPNGASTSGMSGYYNYYTKCGFSVYGDSVLGSVTANGAFSGTAVTSFVGLDSKINSSAYRTMFGPKEFANCTHVTSMTFSRAGYLNFGSDTFSGCTSLMNVTFTGRTKSDVQNTIWGVTSPEYAGYNRSTYPFGLPSGCVIHCSDGDLAVS